AIAATVRAARPDAEVWASDIDPDAVAAARRNLPPDRVREGDLYDALPTSLRGRVDVLVANAPYVPTEEIAFMPAEAREHEHRAALAGGADGHAVQARSAAGSREWLAPGGRVIIETSRRQAPRTASLLEQQGFQVRVVRDEERDGTCVVAGLGGAEGSPAGCGAAQRRLETRRRGGNVRPPPVRQHDRA